MVMKIQSNDEKCFRQVYQSYFPLLLRVVVHLTDNPDMAEEICQETFIRFFDKSLSFPCMEEAKFWLIRVAKNLAINQIKRRMRELRMVAKLGCLPREDEAVGPCVLVEKESKEAVRRAISTLPEKYRLVIVLKEYADMDYSQIGFTLHISVNNVKVRVFRARKMLEERLRRMGE